MGHDEAEPTTEVPQRPQRPNSGIIEIIGATGAVLVVALGLVSFSSSPWFHWEPCRGARKRPWSPLPSLSSARLSAVDTRVRRVGVEQSHGEHGDLRRLGELAGAVRDLLGRLQGGKPARAVADRAAQRAGRVAADEDRRNIGARGERDRPARTGSSTVSPRISPGRSASASSVRRRRSA
jgi:hypothetical protein